VSRASGLMYALLVFALVAVPLPVILRFDHGHYVTAVVLVALLIGLALWSRASGIVATLAYLIVLGDYRRYAGFFQGYPFSDPLLLVAPVTAFFLAALVFVDGKTRSTSALGLLVAMFAMLMAAEVFNPEQGGVAVGFAGALFYFVPLLWFWIGRSYGGAELLGQLLRWLIVPAAVCTAILGTYQAFFGLLPFEAAWARAVDYSALYVASGIRPLGFFTSAAEHVRFLLIASVVVLAYWLVERSRVIFILPLLLVALFLGSSRGPIVMFVLTGVTLWAVLARNRALWVPRAVLALVIAGGALGAGLVGLQQVHVDSRIDALVTHQVEGLLNPADAEKSTAVGHVVLAEEGLMQGVLSPAGKGLGATTIGATKYGTGVYSAEVDLSNMFYSLGLLGGLLYLTIIVLGVCGAVSLWKNRRESARLAILGIILCTLTAWLLGGEYAIDAIVWFMLGATDRGRLDVAAEQVARRKHAYRLSHA
jgi:hypothetical protein